MNAEKFSNAMREIDDQYIDEAIRYHRRQNTSNQISWIKRGAIAACLCLVFIFGLLMNPPSSHVVSGPGLFTITAYALSANEETGFLQACELEEGIEVAQEYGWNLAISSSPGLPLNLSIADYPNATFDVCVEGGRFILWDLARVTYLDSAFRVGNDTTIYWTNLSNIPDSGTDVQRYTGTQTYVDIIIRDGDHIIGYAVIKVYTPDTEHQPIQSYYALLLQSVSFPKVNGNDQDVTEEYVLAAMEQVKSADGATY